MIAKPADGRLIATGRSNVTSYHPEPYEETDGFVMAVANVAEEFSGDMVGTGSARLILATESASGDMRFTGVERFTGKLGGNSGSFLFENSGTLKDGTLQSAWRIIPGSGTGALKGLRGEAECDPNGYRLTYWFV
jgi:hypothetical protein